MCGLCGELGAYAIWWRYMTVTSLMWATDVVTIHAHHTIPLMAFHMAYHMNAISRCRSLALHTRIK
jgi:hypothetical protein